MIIPDYVTQILDRLETNGYEAFIVGGCVRDFLLGKTPSDYDITTSAEPEQIASCFLDYKTVTTGIRFGTVGIVTKDGTVEVTTYRTEGDYKDNRHPERVEFTKNITDDLMRRDFTVNAIAYSIALGIKDPFYGRDDINNKIIRCVGNPDERFSEDGLRILRAIRFASTLDFKIENETSNSIMQNTALLNGIARERVTTELCKLINGKAASRVVSDYAEVINTVFSINKSNAEFLSSLSSLESKIAVLLLGTENGAESLKELRLSNSVSDKIKTRLKHFGSVNNSTESELRRLIGSIGASEVIAINELECVVGRKGDLYKENMQSKILKLSTLCNSISELEINGDDIKALGVSGRAVGVLLDELLTEIVEERAENERYELLQVALRKINLK